MRIADSVVKLERMAALDSVAGALRQVADLVPRGKVRDALHGVWLGHPLHPAIMLAPASAFLGAGVLDLTRRQDHAATTLIGVGLAAVAPTAATGLVDFGAQFPRQQRVGVVHALANVAASGLYGASLLARLAGRRGLGRTLGFAGLGVLGASAYLGGHLVFRQGAGVNQTASLPRELDAGWHRAGLLAALPEGKPARWVVENVPLLLVRDGEQVAVLADHCAHLSGPLSDGELSDGKITCPWHGSTFRLDDGSVVCGPATAPQPVFRSRVRDGHVEICLSEAD